MDYPVQRKKDPLSEAISIERGFRRTVYDMSIITAELERDGIVPVIVGGSAVEFYTRDWYSTSDIDLAIDKSRRDGFEKAMAGFGFRKEGRMWIREELGLYIEIPADISDISMENLTKIETPNGNAYIIGIEELICDRIQAAEHWKSAADLEQAIRIGSAFNDDIDWDLVRNLCKEGSSGTMLDKLLREVRG